MSAYVDRVQAAAEHDPVVGRGFLRVSGLIDPPGALLRPGLIWRTLRRPHRSQHRLARSSSSALTTADLSEGRSRWSS